MLTEMKSAGLSSICQGTSGEKGSALRAILSVLPLPAPAAPGAVVGAAAGAAVVGDAPPPVAGAVVAAGVAAPAGLVGAVVGAAGAVVGVAAAPPQAARSAPSAPLAPSAATPRSIARRLSRRSVRDCAGCENSSTDVALPRRVRGAGCTMPAPHRPH